MKQKFCKPGQVWWVDLNPIIGSEQRGVRPVYIAHQFSRDLLWVFPLTTKNKTGSWYLPFFFDEQFPPRSNLILSQSRTIDRKRLIRKIGKAHVSEFGRVMIAFQRLTGTFCG